MDKELAVTEFLKATGKAGTIWNVIDILKASPEQYQFCFDLALDMENRNLVKLLYALYPSRVMVEMTLEGVRSRESGARIQKSESGSQH